MDIEVLKELLGDKHAELKAYVEDLAGQRDAARKESIDGRKQLKAKVAELESAQARVLERLGIDSLDDMGSLPDGKGQAEAAKQFEAKLKRAEKELFERTKAYGELEASHRASLMDNAISKALSGHDWLDADIAALMVRQSVAYEGDELVYKAGDRVMTVDDGIKTLVASKPHLLKQPKPGGSGYGSGQQGGGTPNPWKKETFNLTQQIDIARDKPQLAAQMMAEAGTAPSNAEPIVLI